MPRLDDKRVYWHTETYYKHSADNSCLICLTERERYLLRQALEQMSWESRWVVKTGDSLPDIDALSASLEFKLDNCTDLEASILSAIETNSDIQDEINIVANTGVTGRTDDTFDSAISLLNLLSGAEIETCSNDSLFGAMTGLVDLMNDLAIDIIEKLSAQANTAGRIGDVIEAIPLLGEFPADDLFQITESLMDDWEQNYQANYTVALRDDYRCGLFCIAKDADCFLSFEDIFDFFWNQLGQSVPTTDLLAFIQWFINNPLTSVSLVHAWHLFLAGILRFAGSVLGIDSARLVRMVSALYNNPDSDWNGLCDCTWSHTWDFSVNSGNFDIWQYEGFNLGVYVTDTHWSYTSVGSTPNFSRGVGLTRTFGSTTIDKLQFTYDYTRGSYSHNNTAIFIGFYLAGVLQASQSATFSQMSNGTGLTYTLDYTAEIDKVGFFTRSSLQTTAVYSGSCAIKSVTIWGTGANPFI